MRGELVALDLETTGLSAESDAIIEVGAVRLVDGQIVEEFGTLVHPDRSIPAYITHITGIRNEDVTHAPALGSVLSQVVSFVGTAPIIGHNVRFDTGFLQRQGILRDNVQIDTYELASVLLPRAPRYTLSSLAQQIQIDLENAHRALDDARATALLYWMLWEKALALPHPTLREIVSLAKGLEWDARPTFEAALQEQQTSGQTQTNTSVLYPLFEIHAVEKETLRPSEEIIPIAPNTVTEILGDSGVMAQRLEGYEKRDQQIAMATAITEFFNTSQHAFIEAGTGTGKSIAYLIPSILWATQNRERVVISTNTINLQEQLIDKDLPKLAEILDTPFKAVVLKGRSNYLCPRRLAIARRRQPTHVDALRTLAKILVWLLESKTGDRGEISLRGPIEQDTWGRLSAEDEGCGIEQCKSQMDGICPFYRARKAAESAHLIVINHALLISDAMTENQVLPRYRYLVIDEGHHLEDATTNALTFWLDEATLQRRLADLGTPQRGLLGALLSSTQNAIPAKDYQRLNVFIETITQASGAMRVHISGLFEALRTYFKESTNHESGGEYATQIRITPQARLQNGFMHIEAQWHTLQQFFDALSGAMERLASALDRLQKYDIPDFADLVNSTITAAHYLSDANRQIQAFVTDPDPNGIYWLNSGQNLSYLSINTAPLHVGPLVEQYLWNAKNSIIVTSATLQTNGNFNYVEERLSAQDVSNMDVGTPFDYKNSTLVFLPSDMPEPNDRQNYQHAVERGIIELAAALEGRVLVLFTSYAHLRQTAQAISPRLALGNITVYDQSDGSSRQALLDGFKSTEKAVLLGTKSFWEGVDIPGEALSALVIVRLPFAVPTDPVFAARSETYESAFNEYTIPEAILRFRQGFGRLIRTREDRGIVAIFDRRIVSKSYGMNFLESLPDFTTQHGPLNTLPEAAREWLNRP
ncbi:MAG: DEAD/DEAH box helicase family protein [Anaerolineaceae bacterium]|nr:DEAD/DEAH box helicase family protein [Anaerolineaceae bacterium]